MTFHVEFVAIDKESAVAAVASLPDPVRTFIETACAGMTEPVYVKAYGYLGTGNDVSTATIEVRGVKRKDA